MDQVNSDTPNLCDVLNAKIRKYKREHPRLNSSQIARRFGISSSTFNRIENKDIRNPSIEQAIKVLQGTCSVDEVSDFIRKYYPSIHSNLFKSFAASTKDRNLSDDQDKFFADESTYKFMMYASNKSGLEEAYVLEQFGKAGYSKFMKLASDGVLKNRDGRFFFSEGDTFLTGAATFKINEFAMREAAESMRTNGEVKGTQVDTVFEQVCLKKIAKELKDLTSEFNGKVRQMFNKPENAGSDLVQVSSMLKKF